VAEVDVGTGITVSVRYFAGAAAAAGLAEETVTVPASSTLAELLSVLAAGHRPALPTVLAASSYLLNEVHAEPEDRLGAGATVDVLPPFAGG
jgi:molybdopterin synthase sulfur carrier subunit